jgi:hypothetical protein
MRNPERIKNFLQILYKYNRQILNEEICISVAKDIINAGLYKPTKIPPNLKNKFKNGDELSDEELDEIIEKNPQKHKEAGFEKGWPSRFDTWFKIAKEFGFVWYKIGDAIEFSDTGNLLIQENGIIEIKVFANVFYKYIRGNPFRRVLNKNNPLVLLLETIKLLNADKDFKPKGISKMELPLLLCWHDDNAKELYCKIKSIRKKYGYKPTAEVILEECYALLDTTKRDDDSLIKDLPDEFIRKMRISGLLSLRGEGRFLDINKQQETAVDYILNNPNKYFFYSTERDFYSYMSTIDNNLVDKIVIPSTKENQKSLKNWASRYSWEQVKSELIILANSKHNSKDEILSHMYEPLRLEFLVSLALFERFNSIKVEPNYIADDEGLPINFAPGGKPDIVCYENNDMALVEVTLLNGIQQYINEAHSVEKHLLEYAQKYKNNNNRIYSIFIAPSINGRMLAFSRFLESQHDTLRVLEIKVFICKSENNLNLDTATS